MGDFELSNWAYLVGFYGNYIIGPAIHRENLDLIPCALRMYENYNSHIPGLKTIFGEIGGQHHTVMFL